MKTLLPVLLLALLPGVVVGQSPNVIARNCAPNSSEAIFNSDGRGSEEGGDGNVGNVSEVGKDTVPQAQLKIASPDARASHPSRDDDGGIASPDARASHPARDDVNGTTLAVLLANRPDRFTEEQWLKMMQEPVNQALFPLRVTQGMLDTLDGREMDLRFRYIFIPDQTPHHGPRIR